MMNDLSTKESSEKTAAERRNIYSSKAISFLLRVEQNARHFAQLEKRAIAIIFLALNIFVPPALFPTDSFRMRIFNSR
jgi:hypothetical protein